MTSIFHSPATPEFGFAGLFHVRIPLIIKSAIEQSAQRWATRVKVNQGLTSPKQHQRSSKILLFIETIYQGQGYSLQRDSYLLLS